MKIRHQQGFALAFSLLFLFVVISAVAVWVLAATNGFRNAGREADLKRAYYAADAGITDAFIQLRINPTPPMSFNVNNTAYAVGGGKTASYAVSVVGTGSTLTSYAITSVGTYKGVSKTLVLTAKQKSMAAFAYLSNTEIHPAWGALWWITGMTTVGPTRTNGSFNIWGSPIFDGPVAQAGSAVNYWNGGPPADNPDWAYGLTLNAPRVALPVNTILTTVSNAASSGGLLLTGDSTIVFNSNGTMNVTNTAKGWNNTNMSLPGNGTIYVQGGIPTVQGTVKGQVTVGGDSDVYISGNLMYNTDPRTNPASTDVLGLVAQNNVTVLANSAPTNLELDAVLVALNGSFQVDQWWMTGKGNMVQFGSLMNSYCGPTGIFDPGTGTLYGGYNQLQFYDTRLQLISPPAFTPAADVTGKIFYVKSSFVEQ